MRFVEQTDEDEGGIVLLLTGFAGEDLLLCFETQYLQWCLNKCLKKFLAAAG